MKRFRVSWPPKPDQIALVTGGSRGIGRALASEFAAHGYALGLVARQHQPLEATADELRRRYGVPVWSYAVDLTEENAAERLRRAVEADGVTVKVLINNAGTWSSGAVFGTDLADLERVVVTNALVPLRMSKAFLPHLGLSGGGGILNVGSLAGTLPTPTFATYGASKAFLVSLSHAMSHELAAQGIRVCMVMPGVVATDFTSSDREGIWSHLTASSTEAVAFAAFRGFVAGQSSVVPGLLSRLLYFGISCFPRSITQGIFIAATVRQY